MLGQLIPCGGGQPIPLLRTQMILGRTGECDIRLPFGTVSSRHCRLELREGAWFVSDLDSRNGVRVDGVRCREARLAPGSILWIAQHRYQLDYVPRSGGVTPLSSRSSASERPVSDGNTARAGRPPPSASVVREPRSIPRVGASLGELIPCGGGDPVPLTKDRLVIGRAPDCDIMLAFPAISAKHCQLEFQEGYWHVRDLGSRNGIRVDGIVQLSKYLRPGEVLWIAKLRFEIVYTPLADEPPPDENPFGLSLLEKAGLTGPGAAARALESLARDEDTSRKRWSIDATDLT